MAGRGGKSLFEETINEQLQTERNQMPKKIVYLKKANNDFVSNCKCNDGRITYPPQMDCPWCGCGWLYTCISCRQAFSFAVGVELETTLEELATTDWKGWGLQRVSKKNIASWVKDMKRLLADVKPGKIYACLDGKLIEKNARNIEFDGIYASHKFDRLPHTEALKDRGIEKRVLASTDYWRSHKLKRKKK
jgi:hypothetical protein